MTDDAPSEPVCVAALYRFARFDDCGAIRSALAAACRRHGIRGTLIVPAEGINGTIAGSDAGIEAVNMFVPGTQLARIVVEHGVRRVIERRQQPPQ